MSQIEILLSHVAAHGIEDFDKAVADYIDALHAHRFTVDEPAPVAHPLVEQVVKRVQEKQVWPWEAKPDTFVSNYKLVDDVTLTLAQKKDALEGQVHAAVREWTEKNTIHRRRLAILGHRVRTAFGTPSALISSEQAAAAATLEQNGEKIAVIQKYMAEQLDAIEDLTEATVDGWKPEPLP